MVEHSATVRQNLHACDIRAGEVAFVGNADFYSLGIRQPLHLMVVLVMGIFVLTRGQTKYSGFVRSALSWYTHGVGHLWVSKC